MKCPIRKPTRLKEYDYSQNGAYFITICAHQKRQLFGNITNAKNQLTDIGKVAEQEILKIESHYTNIRLDKYVIMPNHIHMIIIISEAERINPFPTIKYDIPNVIGKFKAGITRIVGNALMHSDKNIIWQRSFYDHIIRGKEDYQKIWEYIDTNVIRWEKDCFYNNKDNSVI